jgi:hypothetical protein
MYVGQFAYTHNHVLQVVWQTRNIVPFFLKFKMLVVSSVSDSYPHWIRIQLASWIRIRIRNADPDLGGVKPAKHEGKNGAKRQKIHHEKLNYCSV